MLHEQSNSKINSILFNLINKKSKKLYNCVSLDIKKVPVVKYSDFPSCTLKPMPKSEPVSGYHSCRIQVMVLP